MSRPVLVTARIRLEAMTSRHLPLLVELDADADAVGLGWWVGWRLGDGDFLGWWDLSPRRPVPADPASAEAGWRLARRHWRRGCATEGAMALLDHGFVTVGLDEVWAQTMAVDAPSRAR